MAIEEDVAKVLLALASHQKVPNDPERGRHGLDGAELLRVGGLPRNRLKDAVDLLENDELIERKKFVHDNIGYIKVSARGRREAERIMATRATAAPTRKDGGTAENPRANRDPIVSALDNAPTKVNANSPSAIEDPAQHTQGSHDIAAMATNGPTNRFNTLKRLGEGAFGDVWRAQDLRLGREVAIKFLRTTGDASALEHARALVRVPHPNIVAVFDLTDVLDPVTAANVNAIVMELVEGPTLNERLERALSADEARRIGFSLLDAIAAYHRLGLAHMDLHGDNVIIGDVVKVLDPLYYDTAHFRSTATRESERVRIFYSPEKLIDSACLVSGRVSGSIASG